MKVILPWPDRKLSPNARVHWAQKSKAAKVARNTALALSWDAFGKVVDWEGDVHVQLDFYPPSKRRYDLDNAIAAMKSSLDGIADALSVDDSRFCLHTKMHAEVRGLVEVTITKDKP